MGRPRRTICCYEDAITKGQVLLLWAFNIGLNINAIAGMITLFSSYQINITLAPPEFIILPCEIYE